MAITQPEHIDQDAERALRAAFHEDIRAGGLSIAKAVVAMQRISRLAIVVGGARFGTGREVSKR